MAQTLQYRGLQLISEDIYTRLRHKILACELAPGERLEVYQIARQMGVSYTPVKDALRKLLAEGLISIRPRKGTFVSQIHPESIRESFELREAVEIKACELLPGRLTAIRFRALRTINEQIGRPTNSLDDHVRLDGRFHQLLVTYADNRRMTEVYSHLHAHLHIAQTYYGSEDWKDGVSLAKREHSAIIGSLESKRFEEACVILKNHIRRSMALLTSALNDRSEQLNLVSSAR